jgi:diguanylate cyclase (GGDEF)-like protein
MFNRAYFFAALDREIERSARSKRGFSMLMLDLDGLKPINDRHGHFHGDRVLRGVGEVIRHRVRRIDTAARYGGDEFVVLLPETEPSGAYVLAEKIRSGVAELGIEAGHDRIRTSLSIGMVTFPADGRSADALMIAADQAMYASKRRGKNRIVAYGGRGAAARRDRTSPVSPGGATRRRTRRETVGTAR